MKITKTNIALRIPVIRKKKKSPEKKENKNKTKKQKKIINKLNKQRNKSITKK